MGPKLWASGVYSRPRWSEEEDERVLAVASAVALGRSGGAHIVGRGVVARRRQAVKGPMECERGHECSGECYRAGGLGTDGSIKRRMGIERTRGWMRGRSPWCRFRHAEWKWNCGSGGIPDSLTLTHGPRARVICMCTHELGQDGADQEDRNQTKSRTKPSTLLFRIENGPPTLQALRSPGQPLVDDWDCLKQMVS